MNRAVGSIKDPISCALYREKQLFPLSCESFFTNSCKFKNEKISESDILNNKLYRRMGI